MDIVLGVSMTSSTVRMVLVEGDKGDGVTVDHDVFDVAAEEGEAASPADQVVAAILGTQESAIDGGHTLKAVGVVWVDHDEAAKLRGELSIRRLEDVFLVSELHAAGALAQAVGRAVGYLKTAVLLVNRDTATMAVVETDSGSIVKVDTKSLHSADAMAVFAQMATAVDGPEQSPDGIYVLGSGVDAAAVKTHIENLVSLPVHAPDEPDMALARGAALAAAAAPRYEASTTGLAYSQDPEEEAPGTMSALAFSAAATELAPDFMDADELEPEAASRESNRSFMLAGSALGSIFVVGVAALVVSLAVNIRPTVDQRPEPGESVIVPSAEPAPPQAQEQAPAPEAAEPAPIETIQAPVPVAAPRTVYAESAPVAQAPAVQAPAADPPAAVVTPAPAAPAPVVEAPVVQSPSVGTPPLWVPQLIPTFLFPRPVWEPDVPTYRPQTPTYRPQTPTYRPQSPSWPTQQPQSPSWPTQQPQSPNWPTQQPQNPVVVPTVPQQPQSPSWQEPQQSPSWPFEDSDSDYEPDWPDWGDWDDWN